MLCPRMMREEATSSGIREWSWSSVIPHHINAQSALGESPPYFHVEAGSSLPDKLSDELQSSFVKESAQVEPTWLSDSPRCEATDSLLGELHTTGNVRNFVILPRIVPVQGSHCSSRYSVPSADSHQHHRHCALSAENHQLKGHCVPSAECYQRRHHRVSSAKNHQHQRHRVPSAESHQRQRQAANARERKRMESLNRAYERLRGTLPNTSHKLSKHDTLLMALCYISQLRSLSLH